MKDADFVTIYTTFNDLPMVQRVLPGVLEEARRTDTAVIVHDCSTKDTDAALAWYREMAQSHDFFWMMSSRLSLAHARNLCLQLAMEMHTPQWICMLEDDHGYRPGAIDALRDVMRDTYGRRSPNGLRYGLYSLCPDCWGPEFRAGCQDDGQGNLYPSSEARPMMLGGANSCCRCAPASHWQAVLKGYDPDEYAISFHQTRNLNLRNYHRGFTTLYPGAGRLVQREDRPGAGVAMLNVRFDDDYTRSDRRSRVGAAR